MLVGLKKQLTNLSLMLIKYIYIIYLFGVHMLLENKLQQHQSVT